MVELVLDAHNSNWWLYHFICSYSVNSMVTYLYILDKCPSSVHLPVGLAISTAKRCINNEKHADKMPPIYTVYNAMIVIYKTMESVVLFILT